MARLVGPASTFRRSGMVGAVATIFFVIVGFFTLSFCLSSLDSVLFLGLFLSRSSLLGGFFHPALTAPTCPSRIGRSFRVTGETGTDQRARQATLVTECLMTDLPAGTVTFLLTDIESSSRHWEEAPNEMRAALSLHDTAMADIVARHGGSIVKHLGDGCWAAFDAAPAAAETAIDLQRKLQAQPENIRKRLKVRIGLHTGNVNPTDGDYFGTVPNRMARVADFANGDQIVCSSATAGLLADFDLRSEGLHKLRGIGVDEVSFS
jgi:class 3 adenylate cyclase